jgi:hypothetical protein
LRLKDWVLLHGGALGDFALTLRLALQLPDVEPTGVIQVISRTDPGDLSGGQPSVRRISSEGIGLHWLFAEGNPPEPTRLRELVSGRRVLNALGGANSIVHSRLVALGAREVFSFDPRPKPGLDLQITMQWRRALERQGVSFAGEADWGRESRAIVVADDVRQRGLVLLAPATNASSAQRSPTPSSTSRSPKRGGAPPGGAIEGSAILIHPGSGGRAKCWPLAGFFDVARRLRELGEGVCFVLGPVEVERWSPAEMNTIRDEFPLVVSPTPDDLLGLLAATRALVSNDAGPAHLAALIGTPTVTIFGPTSAAVWRPLGVGARVVAGDPERHPEDWGIDPRRVVEALPDDSVHG